MAQTMARLVAAGVMLPTAERVARGDTEIGPGIRVVVEVPALAVADESG